MEIFGGIDLGSSYTKCVLINKKHELLASHIVKTSISFQTNAETVLAGCLQQANRNQNEILSICATGVGRSNCSFADFNKPEIICFARGAWHFHPKACIVVDIGGQDNKVIRLSDEGQQLDFKMNRKCAAGTGSFLQEISRKMDLTTEQMNEYAAKSQTPVTIGSFCTVFTATEIIHHIRTGQDINGILRGVFESVVKRILEMDPLAGTVVLTGGAIARNPVLVDIFREKLTHAVFIPPSPQMVGAHGAAILAAETWHREESERHK